MGLWALFTTITGMVEMVKVGLLRNATIKFIHQPGYNEDKKEIQMASLMINIVFTIIIILLVVLFGKLLANVLNTPRLYHLLLLSIPLFILLISV